jgi:hypothetical protein
VMCFRLIDAKKSGSPLDLWVTSGPEAPRSPRA